jgi:tight adherence protein C
MADRARRLSPRSSADAIQRRLDVAGRGDRWSVDQVFAARLLAGGFVGVFVVLTLVSSPDVLVLLLGALITVGAFWFPDFYLHNRGVERQRVVQLELPDTLDQMTISVEAGLGLEAAMARIARQGEGPVAEEFSRTLQDIQLGRSRAAALENLLDRTDVKDLRHFVLALGQADKLGVPLAQTLRAQAGDMRTKRKLRAEEQAAKLPVKLVFPLIFCILPSLFVVMLAPPIIDFIESGVFPSL